MRFIKVVGVMFEGRQELLEELYDISAKEIIVVLRREPSNTYDKNAIKVVLIHEKSEFEVGYISADNAVEYAQQLDSGTQFDFRLSKIDKFKGTYYCELADMTV